MRRVLPGVLPVLCAALLSTARPARAQAPDDEVDLVDGTAIHGRVTEQVPGSHVIIQSVDGRTESIPWSQVKRVATGAAPPAVVVAAPVRVAEVPATADESVHAPVPVHFEAGVRLGYAFSSGDYAAGAPMGTSSSASALPGVSAAVPFTLDAGIRIGPYVFVGGSFQYALLDSSCFGLPGVDISCGGHDMRGGIELIAHVAPRARVDPWIGAGIGHEWLELDVSVSGGGASAQAKETFDGWNFADLMLGVDFHVGPAAAIGPYFELTSGSFTSVSSSSSGGAASPSSSSADIGNQSSHQWFTLGLRGTYEVL